jgi:hypothetical protein
MLQISVVLMTGDLEKFVVLPAQRNLDRPRPRVRNQIRHSRPICNEVRVDRDETLDDRLGVAHHFPDFVQPGLPVQILRFDDKGVAFPVAHRIAHPLAHGLRQMLRVHANHAGVVHHFIQDHH